MSADFVAFLEARWDDTAREAPRIHHQDCAQNEYDPSECDCGVPARVLAGIQAKRAVLAEHAPWTGKQNDAGVYCSTCVGYPIDIHVTIDVAWPCPTVRLLASVHADHPDWDPGWAATGV